MTGSDKKGPATAEDKAGSTRLVCFAVKEEAVFFRSWAGSQANVQLLVTGMGRKNAKMPGMLLSFPIRPPTTC